MIRANADTHFVILITVLKQFLSVCEFFITKEFNMDQGYRNLWAAVLKQAVKDAKRNFNNSTSSPGLWFHSKSHAVGSFLWICSVLNIDPESVKPDSGVEMKRAA